MVITYDVKRMIGDLKLYLKDNHLSMRQFSEKSGVNTSVLSRFINGKYIPAIDSGCIQKILICIEKTISDYDTNEYICYTKPVSIHVTNCDEYGRMSITELNDCICMLNESLDNAKKIRNEKIQIELDNLQNTTNYYKNMLEEET